MASDANVTRVDLDGGVFYRKGQQFLSGTGYAGERLPRVHRVEPHGFTSHPVAGGIATVLASRGNRDSLYAMGGAKPALVPELPPGGTAIYDHLGNIVSIVEAKIRVVHAQEVWMEAGDARVVARDNLIKLRLGADWIAVLDGQLLSSRPIIPGADPDPSI
ncbi:phage baseplate assembly protein [Ancylobacter sp. WKF20]|uniref:phage baseplate assembly protein domain-containing protein n=1 Tax=Ancylobacter sp. WKF20 TaxID=3039801 RepID=UPI0024343A22|nr:phage baseplate assembly protein [Ancylobacter sp. WKF20]WGD31197.1 phage baseplate assembly protein [Ancylobacter sp. WKF20]